MPTRALQAVSFNKAPSARFIWYLCRVDGVDACSSIKDAGVAQNFPPLVDGRRGFRWVGFYLRQERPHLARDGLNLDGRGALFALQRLVHVLCGHCGLLLLRGEFGTRLPVAALAEPMYVVAFNTWKRDGGKHRPHRIWGGKLADS